MADSIRPVLTMLWIVGTGQDVSRGVSPISLEYFRLTMVKFRLKSLNGLNLFFNSSFHKSSAIFSSKINHF